MFLDKCKIFLHYVLPKRALTIFAGLLANNKIAVVKNHLIRNFIDDYQVNMSEAIKTRVEDYACFNDFFIRRLKPECRPIKEADIISPVDGFISEIGTITAGTLLQAKGRHYLVRELLTDQSVLSSQFDSGCFATLYLSPKDYHRVHMPMTARLKEMVYVPGTLFSVQPRTVRAIPRLFARNERLVVFFDTEIGLMAMVLVGATVVGAIGTSWHGDVKRSRQAKYFNYSSDQSMDTLLQKAAEMGYFKLGSTVILLFANGAQVQWKNDLQAGDKISFGDALAETDS